MHATPVTAYIALGANLGNAARTVQEAINNLAYIPNTSLVKHSSLYQTAPIESSGPDYINAVAEILTHLTLDLDILLYGSARIQSLQLTVPHPRMGQRAFVLRPLSDIAPQLVTPQVLQAVDQQGIHRL
jgi:2-amino-4-hydroxy-6-hydroxymethyldihydropteridine diphosphokinase